MGNKKSKYLFEYLEEVQKTYDFNPTVMNAIKKAWRDGNKYCLDRIPVPPKKVYNTPTRELIVDMMCLHGIPPHDGGSNIVRGDGYFANDLLNRVKKAGCSWDEVLEKAKEEGRKIKPLWDR